ncbi:aminopeptidase [Oceanobacillus sp. FSL H7-0719]|uniref:aminopeptidase n=1 Tax=Oceanobacillus sp. FSL H7-0719 TaxID=2954507 RepID=UPI00324952E1
MRVHNTIESFLHLFENDSNFNLNEYHQRTPDVFQTYFNGYCKKTNDKIINATKRYYDDLPKIKMAGNLLPDVIEKVSKGCEAYFGFSIDVPIHVFVGLYASNAFVDHHSAIYLAVEKLHPDPALLEVILTHEMVHSYHNHLLDRAGIDWLSINWDDVRHSVYREGIATYFSQLISPGYKESIYYSYDYSGDKWLTFCKNNTLEIAQTFLTDLENKADGLEQEWLRLSGGKHFGYTRLGYFLGTACISDLCNALSTAEVLALLANNEAAAAFDGWIAEAARD